jgi:hypothetical protein
MVEAYVRHCTYIENLRTSGPYDQVYQRLVEEETANRYNGLEYNAKDVHR